MIKRILVALDPDEDTPIATKFAIRLAKRFDASVTGLAVVDLSTLHTSIAMDAYGAEVMGQKVWDEMAGESRNAAQRIMNRFKGAVEKAGVRHRDIRQEGASTDVIIEEMKYHDLLIIGRDSHFFYNQPERETGTLAKVVKGGDAPVLIATHEYRDVERIMIAFDGSRPAARTMKEFVHLLPYGKDVEVELVNVPDKGKKDQMDRAFAVLESAEAYLREHGFHYITKTRLEPGKTGERILDHQFEKDPDLLLLGAHSVSALHRLTFGSTTHHLLGSSEGALFLGS